MIDRSKKRRKGTITERDAASLLNRYTPQTVLALLKEVSLAAGGKIDWSCLVNNTATGITCAREYRKLWRHIAYGETLADRSYSSADPMDDDGSDLEYEVEAFPPVGREAAVETSACVKVLSQVLPVSDSAHPSDATLQDNRIVDCPLPINIPNNGGFLPSGNGLQGTNIIIPVPLELQPMTTSNGGEKKPKSTKSDSKMPSRRKKKPWSEEEDKNLTAAAQKHGDCNWDSIASNDFENKRNPSELPQRWAFLKKQKRNLIFGGMTSQHSEAERAAAHLAASIAISCAMGDNLKANKTGPDSRVKAAAVAAGARIASSSDPSSLFDAARAQNIVHITTASGVMKSVSSSATSQLPSNVHFTQKGPAKKTPSSAASASNSSVKNPETGEAAAVSTLDDESLCAQVDQNRGDGGKEQEAQVSTNVPTDLWSETTNNNDPQ